MGFERRITQPSKLQSCYYASNPFYQSGYGLPNCTAYAFGRFWEITGVKPKLSLSNAENWFDYNDGYERGQKAKLGAIICYRKGKAHNSQDGAGHVAVVEDIYPDGSILISESHWKGNIFNTKRLASDYFYNNTLTFQGFIYNPLNFEQKVSKYIIGKTYKTNVILRVRHGIGIDKRIKKFEELTENAKAHAYNSGVNEGCLKEGTKVTVLEAVNNGNDIWLRIPSGWVAGYYNGKMYVS